MSVWHLVIREILYRRLSFVLGVVAVAVAAGAVVGQVLLLDQHERRTEEILRTKQAETTERMDALQDDMRKITKNLGFNVRILPKDLNLVDFYARDFADKYMPEAYAEKLAKSKIVTINHLLPSLEQKVHWDEQDMPVVLVGARGEVPIVFQDKKNPILEVVPPGKIVLGYQLHRLLGRQAGKDLQTGDPVKFKGKTFVVHKLHGARGDRDDVTMWIHLKEAQDLLGKQGLINGMLALGCNCSAERLGVIRQEIAGILPDTQVEEFETKATARAEARNKVEAEGQAALAAERRHRDEIRREKEAFAAIVVPLVVLGCCVWLGLMAWLNVLEREGEIGLYRALGLRSTQLFTLFLSRALIVGLVGAVVGSGLGIVSGMLLREEGIGWDAAIQAGLVFGTLLMAPLVSALACWLPALLAVRRDPAIILQRE